MTTKQYTLSFLMASMMILGGCKQESNSGESSSASTIENSADKSNKGCTVANVDGGAQITCGDTSAFVANGANMGPAKKPILYHDEGGSVGFKAVGDYVISVTKDAAENQLITVWVESVDAVAQYENGFISPIVNAVYFNSNDCSGDARYRITWPAPFMVDRLIFGDQYYKLTDEIITGAPQSKRMQDGSCVSAAGESSFYALKAVPVSPGITTVLRHYKIKVQ